MVSAKVGTPPCLILNPPQQRHQVANVRLCGHRLCPAEGAGERQLPAGRVLVARDGSALRGAVTAAPRSSHRSASVTTPCSCHCSASLSPLHAPVTVPRSCHCSSLLSPLRISVTVSCSCHCSASLSPFHAPVTAPSELCALPARLSPLALFLLLRMTLLPFSPVCLLPRTRHCTCDNSMR